jgi:hypothetical protein
MTRPEKPRRVFVRHWRDNLDNLIGLVGNICHNNPDDASPFIEAILVSSRSLRGNRPECWKTTWGDLKAITVATLELCLEELENYEP